MRSVKDSLPKSFCSIKFLLDSKNQEIMKWDFSFSIMHVEYSLYVQKLFQI